MPQLETSSVPTTATFATGGTTDVSKYIDIQMFLMAANGGGFSFETMHDRRDVAKAKVTHPHPKGPVREEPGLNIDPTNIDLIFLQQELSWRPAGHRSRPPNPLVSCSGASLALLLAWAQGRPHISAFSTMWLCPSSRASSPQRCAEPAPGSPASGHQIVASRHRSKTS